MEKTIEVVKHMPQERVQYCAVEQIVGVPVPQIPKEIGEVIQPLPQERISDRVVEQIVHLPSIRSGTKSSKSRKSSLKSACNSTQVSRLQTRPFMLTTSQAS